MLGIYAIIHKATGNQYVGQSSNIEKRFTQHRVDLKRGKHCNPKLQNAWNKYGEAEFEFMVLEECEADNLDEREQSYIDTKPWFNIALFANSNMRGRKHSEKSLAKMSQVKKGILPTKEAREKMSSAAKGRKHTEEALAKMIASKKGVARTPEVRAKISATLKGRPLSEATKAKMRGKRGKRGGVNKKSKPVLCVTTGQVFESVSLAAEHFSGSAGFLYNHLNGQKPSFKGHTFKYVNER